MSAVPARTTLAGHAHQCRAETPLPDEMHLSARDAALLRALRAEYSTFRFLMHGAHAQNLFPAGQPTLGPALALLAALPGSPALTWPELRDYTRTHPLDDPFTYTQLTVRPGIPADLTGGAGNLPGEAWTVHAGVHLGLGHTFHHARVYVWDAEARTLTATTHTHH